MKTASAMTVRDPRAHLRPVPARRSAGAEPATFGPGSFLWEQVGSTLFAPFTLPAFMLQVMHPTISTAVDRHSVFRTDPLGRLIRSMDSVTVWIYGGQAAIDEGRRLRRLHRPIRGTDEHGNRYSALDPEAYAWVHATAFVTAVNAHRFTHGREMTPSEQDRLYGETLQLGRILRVPAREMRKTAAAYWEYYHSMVAHRLARTAVAQELLEMMDAPPLRFLPGPLDAAAWPARQILGRSLYLITVGGMTSDARDALGVRWTPAHSAQLRALMRTVRPLHSRLPERLRYLPLAVHARRHARELQAIRRRAGPGQPPPTA